MQHCKLVAGTAEHTRGLPRDKHLNNVGVLANTEGKISSMHAALVQHTAQTTG
jgi:hypothetical protein